MPGPSASPRVAGPTISSARPTCAQVAISAALEHTPHPLLPCAWAGGCQANAAAGGAASLARRGGRHLRHTPAANPALAHPPPAPACSTRSRTCPRPTSVAWRLSWPRLRCLASWPAAPSECRRGVKAPGGPPFELAAAQGACNRRSSASWRAQCAPILKYAGTCQSAMEAGPPHRPPLCIPHSRPSGGCAPNRRPACAPRDSPTANWVLNLHYFHCRFGPKQPFKGAQISGSLHMTIQAGFLCSGSNIPAGLHTLCAFPCPPCAARSVCSPLSTAEIAGWLTAIPSPPAPPAPCAPCRPRC